ncbi:hypothetical protein E1A91_D05G076600v1 [Gossypium mustelinum]|uniref:BURP domain-containing protein n=1 Tax=Gossypium mustelinum TaxID=34275 RepID=A0A5D2UVY3_GOSMU|nr:hypothetical protein E1A91_D05G076600v1 [Gossypium mustelinum]
MEFNFFFIFILLILALCGVSHASADLAAEVHWKSVFPHTPMPKALKHRLLQPAAGNKPWVVTRKEDSINDGDYGNADPSMGFGRGSIISRTNITMYFFENDLYPESIPFSSDEFPGILKLFSLKPESREAKAMNRTIAMCERRVIEGEDMYCATSLESLVDLSC